MRAQDERSLEEEFVGDPTGTAVEIEAFAVRPIGVLVGQAETQKLRGKEAHVRFDGPLPTGIHGVLRRVVADPERPSAPGLQLTPAVPPEAVSGSLLAEIG